MAQGNDLGTSYDNWFDYAAIGLKLNVPFFSGLAAHEPDQTERDRPFHCTRTAEAQLEWLGIDYRNADTRLTASDDQRTERCGEPEARRKLFAMHQPAVPSRDSFP
jgi:hypothetical protein